MPTQTHQAQRYSILKNWVTQCVCVVCGFRLTMLGNMCVFRDKDLGDLCEFRQAMLGNMCVFRDKNFVNM